MDQTGWLISLVLQWAGGGGGGDPWRLADLASWSAPQASACARQRVAPQDTPVPEPQDAGHRKKLPLPCDSAVFAVRTVPFLAVIRSAQRGRGRAPTGKGVPRSRGGPKLRVWLGRIGASKALGLLWEAGFENVGQLLVRLAAAELTPRHTNAAICTRSRNITSSPPFGAWV